MILSSSNRESMIARRARQAWESSQTDEETLYFERQQEGIHGPISTRPLSMQERAIRAREIHEAEQDQLLFEAQQAGIQKSMNRLA
ncbi:hypothetical protein IV102_20580 [bacterium]|nr:hypothetical protein [bacterium]